MEERGKESGAEKERWETIPQFKATTQNRTTNITRAFSKGENIKMGLKLCNLAKESSG